MKPSWKLLPKILSGEKTIESRWYKTKHAPWGRIKRGDTVYFKDTGKPVTIKATVDRVMQFDHLTPLRIRSILRKYAAVAGIDKKDIPLYWERFKDKQYCLLIFFRNPRSIRPFHINKRGFGAMVAWITISDIHAIKHS